MSIFLRFIFLLSCSLFLLQQCSTLRAYTASSGNNTTTNSSSKDAVRKEVVDYAMQYQGKQYKYGGRTPKTGFDCSGFTHYVLGNFGYELTPVSRIQETEGKTISLREAEAGDLVFFRRSKSGPVFHVALVVGQDNDGIRVIHSTSSRGVIVDNISKSSYWRNKISTARRVIN